VLFCSFASACHLHHLRFFVPSRSLHPPYLFHTRHIRNTDIINQDPCDQDRCDSNTPFVKATNLTCGGWSNDEQLLFVRPEAVALWLALDNMDKALHVEGPPGTGKSTISWAWACFRAKQNMSLLWVHRDHTGSGRVAHFDSDGGIVSLPAKSDLLSQFIDTAIADVVIVDGITKKSDALLGAALTWCKQGDQRKVVVVSSSQIVLPVEDYDVHRMSKYSMPSWSRKQYVTACANDQFYESVKAFLGDEDTKEERLANKFFVAGASARWMFAVTRDKLVEEEIPTYIEELDNMQALISGMNGKRSATAVNHLCMVNKDRKGFIVSEFAMRLIAEKCELSFVSQATNFAKKFKNKSFDGWVFELDFLLQLRLADEGGRDLTVYDGQAEEHWTVGGRESFDHALEIAAMELQDGVWLIPQRWNQGGFDAVQVLGGNAVRFVQVTRAATHTLKLHYFVEVIEQIVAANRQVEAVDVVFVVPPDVEFQAPTAANVVGDLRAWNWNLSMLRVLKVNRSGQK
jgi:hypothetical protein